ncbi:hypothetical protein [Thiomonas sp. FB-6]|uniref:hypothetical protein n=1 Tax=Thiomonas sp. FB-6 TaxID=1158291 RepID=UPI00037A03B1|nr:hypothetical protein [Thiomonas sp. FB-6]
MNLPRCLRSLTARGGILVWMLLAAYACAPWAAALQPDARTVVVPYCSAHAGAPDGHGPLRRIRLSFSATPSVSGGLGWGLPPSKTALPLPSPGRLRVADAAPGAPAWSSGTRRPLPRAPPARPAPSRFATAC